jgi:hypothetical protein
LRDGSFGQHCGLSWHTSEIRVNRTESRFAAGLNRLLQQNRHQTNMQK